MHSGFEDFVRTRGDTLRRFAYLLCGDQHLGEDLVQEVLIKAYRRWPSISRPESYLRTALVRSHVSWLRRRSRRERVEADPVPDPVPDLAQRHAVRSDLWGSLGGLSRMQRAVLVLRYYEDLDDRQIAETLGCGASTVRVHAARGLASLRTSLAPSTTTPGGRR